MEEHNKKIFFASFAREDSNTVYQSISYYLKFNYIMLFRTQKDFEQNEDFSDAINKCNCFLAFISKNFINSDICLADLDAACKLGKSILLIYLEDCNLPSDTEKRISVQNNVFKIPFSNFAVKKRKTENTDNPTKSENGFYSENIAYLNSSIKKDNRGNITVNLENGIQITSEWEKDKLTGYQIISMPDGLEYRGQTENGEINGYGIMVWPDGTKYLGEWENNKQCGHGLMVYSDDGFYDGEWKNDRQNGHGIYTYPRGEKYDGEWKDDERHGFGILTFSNGSKFEGIWKNDKKNGLGVFMHADGMKYSGEWENDKRSGFGILTNPDKSEYIGNWKNDKPNGNGTFIFKDGTEVSGNWKNGILINE